MEKIKYQLHQGKQFTTETFNGAALMAEAVSLLVVTFAAYWMALNVPMRKEYKYVLLVAATIIAMRGMWEFITRLHKIGIQDGR